MYELRLEHYQGPLDKLLALIEERKMEINQVSLAAVTADFLNYLEGFKIEFNLNDGENHEDSPHFSAPIELLADFLVVASRLLLIKSKTLLPSLELTEEETAEIQDLEHRLQLYQELKKTQEHIRATWSETPQIYVREFMHASEPLFYPPQALTANDLRSSVERILQSLEAFVTPKVKVKNQIVHLRVKIQEIIAKLTKNPMRFDDLRMGKEKGELVVLFLAVLHLIKQQIVHVEQTHHFADIMIAKSEETRVE